MRDDGLAATSFWLPASVAVLSTAATLALYFPGTLSNDSITLYKQVVGGYWTDVSPVFTRHLWWLSDRVVCGPGGLLAVHVSIYWLGISLVVFRIARSTALRVLGILVLGFFPPTFGVMAVLWTDVGMTSFLMLGVGLLLALQSRETSRWLAIPTGLVLFYGLSVRHNAPAAALPLLLLFSQILTERSRTRFARQRPRLHTAVLVVSLFALFLGAAREINRYGSTHVRTPVTFFWDLAAISVAVDRMLVPESAHFDLGGDDPLERVRKAFSQQSASSIYWGEHAMAPYGVSAEVARELRVRWWQEVRRYPRAYLEHRRRAAAQQLGVGGVLGWAPTLFVEGPEELTRHCAGGLPHRYRLTPARAALARGLERLTHTHLYRHWVYGVAALGIFLASLAVPGPRARAARWVAASGLLYVVPLLVIAPSVEFRYGLWLISATVVAGPLLVSAILERRAGRR